jgi:tetratricopeptide (TPR) repeat protein
VGDVYLEGLWNIKEAVNEYKRATVLNPNIPLYYFKLGLAQYHLSLSSMALIPGLNNPERILATAKEANDNIRKAAELHFDPPELHLLLGLILNQQTLFQAAEAEINTFFERIQALEKQLASGQPNCSRGLMSLNQGSLQVEKEKAQEFLQSSISSLKRATQLKEGFSGFYSYLGRAYSIKGEYDLAATNYETALRYAKVKSEKAAVLCELGLLYIQLQKPAAAMDNFEKATQYNPNQVSAFIALGTMYALQGRLDDGIKQIEKAVALEPDKLDARIFLGTARLAKWRLTRNPSDFDQTISLLKEIVASKRDFGAGYLALAMAYAENSKVPEALENFQRAVDYSPKEAQTYFFRGKFYAEVVFNDAAAIESLKQAIELDPNSFEAHGYLGMLYARTGRQPEAIKYLTKAIELRPKSTSAMMFMPNALPSVTDIQQLYFTLAEIHRSRNEFSDAIRILKAASEIPTAQQIGYTALASLYEQTKEYDEAANYYEKAALVSASDAFNWNYFMGRATRLRGRYTDAIGFFRNLASLNPALGAYEIGLTHVRDKNKSEALAQYTQLVQLKSPFAEDLLKQINEMK